MSVNIFGTSRGLGHRLAAGCMAALLLCGAMTACTPGSSAMGDTTETPLAEPSMLLPDGVDANAEDADHLVVSGSFRSFDGVELPLRAWLPYGGPPKAILLALHGFNDYAKAFEPLGSSIAPRGVAVYAYDQRGFGAGVNVGIWAGMGRMTGDLRAAAARLRADHPGVPLYILGESMGAPSSWPARPRSLARTVSSCRLLRSGLGNAAMVSARGLVARVANRALVSTSPQGLDIQASDNIEMLRALGQDPLVLSSARWTRSRGWSISWT